MTNNSNTTRTSPRWGGGINNILRDILKEVKENNVLIFINPQTKSTNETNEDKIKEYSENLFNKLKDIIKEEITSYEAITKYDTFICTRRLIEKPILMKNPGYKIFVVSLE
jgi:hypothetical protein